MIATYNIKVNGVWYKAGEEIPGPEKEQEAPVAEPEKTEEKAVEPEPEKEPEEKPEQKPKAKATSRSTSTRRKVSE